MVDNMRKHSKKYSCKKISTPSKFKRVIKFSKNYKFFQKWYIERTQILYWLANDKMLRKMNHKFSKNKNIYNYDDYINKEITVHFIGKRKITGILKCYDQYSNFS